MSFLRRHVNLLVRTNRDEIRQVRWIHVGVREAAAERENLLHVALVSAKLVLAHGGTQQAALATARGGEPRADRCYYVFSRTGSIHAQKSPPLV